LIFKSELAWVQTLALRLAPEWVCPRRPCCGNRLSGVVRRSIGPDNLRCVATSAARNRRLHFDVKSKHLQRESLKIGGCQILLLALPPRIAL